MLLIPWHRQAFVGTPMEKCRLICIYIYIVDRHLRGCHIETESKGQLVCIRLCNGLCSRLSQHVFIQLNSTQLYRNCLLPVITWNDVNIS